MNVSHRGEDRAGGLGRSRDCGFGRVSSIVANTRKGARRFSHIRFRSSRKPEGGGAQ
jgi:hypothetical protein